MRQLCKGLPPEWWCTDDDGARLAMAICRRCPAQLPCSRGEIRPHGVIRAGAPFSDTGRLLADCPTCGYPQPGDRINGRDQCPRCEVPPLARFRTDIERWAAAGIPNRVIASRLGVTRNQISDARLHWRKQSARRSHSGRAPSTAARRAADMTTTGFKERSQRIVHERIDAAERLTRRGASAAAIAVRLDVTPRTVIRYRARLRQQQCQ